MFRKSASLQDRQEQTGREKVLIVSNYIDDLEYGKLGSSRAEMEEQAIGNIRSMVNTIAKYLFEFPDVDFEVINIADPHSIENIQKAIGDTSLAIFSGGPQNIVDTDEKHLQEAEKLRVTLRDTLERIKSGELEKLRLMTICLSHQALGELLGMEVKKNKNGLIKGQQLIEVSLTQQDLNLLPEDGALEKIHDEQRHIVGRAYHQYSVDFEPNQVQEGLQVREIARRIPENPTERSINYGLQVLGANGHVQAGSFQFHPEDSFREQANSLVRYQMADFLIDVFGNRSRAVLKSAVA